MADATTLIRDPSEKLSAFNERIAVTCERGVTDVQLVVIDGHPAVTLYTSVDEATDEDVDAGDADAVGDVVFTGPLLCCKVALIRVEETSEKAEGALNDLYDEANGRVVDVEVVTGNRYEWVKDPQDPKAAPVYKLREVAFALCVWEVDDDDVEDDEGETPDAEPESESESESEAETSEADAEVEPDE